MRNPDETDLKILHLLAEDGRRSYTEIAEHVGLSGPAVSERVRRLEEQGIIKGFKVDVDRSKLGRGLAVLVSLNVKPGHVEEIHDTLNNVDDVEHVYSTVSSKILVHTTISNDGNPRAWVVNNLDFEKIRGYDVDIVSDFDWNLNIKAATFSLTCVECGKTITDGGVVTRVEDEIKQFCCTSCEARYVERYEELRENAT